MIFLRIFNNKLYEVHQTDRLGFSSSDASYIPDEYLSAQVFTIFRTAFGIGDWGIISAMPRLLKEKYPNCTVSIPSLSFCEQLFGDRKGDWGRWSNPFLNPITIFNNNPYIDSVVDEVDGDIFHDHYRIYDEINTDVALIKQILKFWQFTDAEMADSQPELYWTPEEQKFGNKIIQKYVGENDFGALLVTNKLGTQLGKVDKNLAEIEMDKINEILENNRLPYFYFTDIPLSDTNFNHINGVLDMRHIDIRIQLYIRSKAKLNIGNQTGILDILPRYSKTYIVQRQFPIKHNFIEGALYI